VVKTVDVVKLGTAMCGGLRAERHVEWGTAGAPALEHLPLPLVLELLLSRPLPLSLALALHFSPSLALALALAVAVAVRQLDPPPVLQ
jgi:hypothetical protein